jgi:hypothetical protein
MSEVAQAIDSTTPSALEYGRKWFESNHRRSADRVKASIVLQPWVRETATKVVIRPLKEKIRHGIEHRVLVNRPFLEFNSADLAKSILVVFEHGTGKELIKNLGLPPCERHYEFSVLNHCISR